MRQALHQRRGLLCFTPCQQPNIYLRPMEKPSPLSPPDPRAALGRGPAFYASVLALSVDRVPSATGVSWQLLSPDGTEKDGDCRLDVGIHVQCPAGATRISPIHQQREAQRMLLSTSRRFLNNPGSPYPPIPLARR
ncbi:hypothetical protein C8Q70DRAFT_685035 [Cubamyces menziesii]|nr:hypothetical protein C8Q70DRAFT_685035 [Cubamyces menziesii]